VLSHAIGAQPAQILWPVNICLVQSARLRLDHELIIARAAPLLLRSALMATLEGPFNFRKPGSAPTYSGGPCSDHEVGRLDADLEVALCQNSTTGAAIAVTVLEFGYR